MKIKVQNYTFNKALGQITFIDYPSLRLDGITLITNVESNIIIYIFGKVGKGGSVSGNVLTLDYNTSAMNDSDALQIFYEDEDAEQPVRLPQDQIDDLTPPPAITGFATAAKQDTGNTTLSTLEAKIPPSPSTSGKQDIGNTSLNAIDTKIPVQGQALAAASLPVVLPAAQISALTPPAAITGFATSTKQDTGNTSLGSLNTNLGAVGDAAIVSDVDGSISGKIRGLVKILASVWDSTNNWLNFRRVKQDTFAAAQAFTITLASLANSAVGVGQQSTLITGNKAESALIGVKFTTGTTPTANSLVYVYLIRGDGTLKDDNAGNSDAALTVVNAPLLGVILIPAASSNTAYTALFDTKSLGSLGPVFGIAIVNNSGVAANATPGNFTAEYSLIT